jgi:hypothetical protein
VDTQLKRAVCRKGDGEQLESILNKRRRRSYKKRDTSTGAAQKKRAKKKHTYMSKIKVLLNKTANPSGVPVVAPPNEELVGKQA